MQGYFITDPGQVRSVNEDSGGIFNQNSSCLMAMVADGMGGHQAGDVASNRAVTYMKSAWEKDKSIIDAIQVESWLQQTVEQMNAAIFELSKQQKAYEGMGTTVVIGVCTEAFITIAHIGDSRAYLLENSQLKQLTSDHSLVNELVQSGQLTEEEASQHPNKNVLTRAAGTESTVQIDIHTYRWQPGDQLLFCSDGLTNKLTDQDLQQAFESYTNKEVLMKELIHQANERGGEDNITAALVENTTFEDGDGLC